MESPNNRFGPATVSESYLAGVIEARRPLGLFLARATAKSQPGARWIAVDNSTGDAWTEDFPSLAAAIAWLVGDGEAEEYWPQIIEKRIEAPRAINPKAKRKANEVIFVMKPAKRNDEVKAAREWLKEERK